MELEVTLAAVRIPATFPALARASGTLLVRAAIAATVIGLFALAGYVWLHEPYTAGSDLGYNLGLVGGVLMLLLLLFSLRKRLRWMRTLGTMKGWFLFHIAAGLLGPLLVLFHSTFRIGSFNGGVALVCTLLVTASGIVGRFLYRRIHRGLSGNRATLQELQSSLERQMQALQPRLAQLPLVREEIARFAALLASPPAGRWRRAAHLLSLGTKRVLAGRRVRQAIAARTNGADWGDEIDALVHTVDAALTAAQRSAQFVTYERLFSLWHAVHIPFLYLLVLTAIVHVVAVHAY